MPQALIVTSLTHNPWNNLALEEHLFELLSQSVHRREQAEAEESPIDGSNWPEAILYLWQNDQTVVIGRNQNAWAECNTAQLEADGGFLARRTTGGGAVFHDLGNLNFSLLLPQHVFDLDRNFQMLTDTLIKEGIPAERSGRNDILVEGLKISGNAFRLNRGVGLHHGTLLVNSEFTRLARYLTVNPAKLQAKGITSVRSRVANLVTIRPVLSIPHMMKTLEAAFLETFCPSAIERDDLTQPESPAGPVWSIVRRTDADYQTDTAYQALCEKFSSWDWRYGQTLQFDAQVEERFIWGHVQIGLSIKGGRVRMAQVYSDALDSDFIDKLASSLEGQPFHSDALIRAVDDLANSDSPFGISRRTMSSDVASLFLAQGW